MNENIKAFLDGVALLPPDQQREFFAAVQEQHIQTLEASLAALAAAAGNVPVEKRVKKFVDLRDARAAANKVADRVDKAFKSALETIEKSLLATAAETGTDGFKTEYGTAYKEETMHASIADDTAFYDFVRTSGDLDFFERRIKIAHIKEYQDANEGRLPPGLNVFREFTMRVRRK